MSKKLTKKEKAEINKDIKEFEASKKFKEIEKEFEEEYMKEAEPEEDWYLQECLDNAKEHLKPLKELQTIFTKKYKCWKIGDDNSTEELFICIKKIYRELKHIMRCFVDFKNYTDDDDDNVGKIGASKYLFWKRLYKNIKHSKTTTNENIIDTCKYIEYVFGIVFDNF